jgi:hypothetical protein
MAEPLRIDPGDRTADEIVDELTEGRRILVSVEMLGRPHEISLRYDGTWYYCDTPTRLHKHDNETEMRNCVREMGYGK